MKVAQKCVLCGHDEADLLYAPLNIVRCRTCRLTYRDAVLESSYYIDLNAYRESLEDTVKLDYRRNNARARLDLIGPHLPRQGKLFDIGTNEGFFLLEARNRGFSVAGCEPNRFAADFAKAQGLDITEDTFDLGFPEIAAKGPWDIVTLFHVLEHFPNPVLPLRKIRELLSDNGKLVVEVPDFASPVSRVYGWEEMRINKEHLFYYTIPTLTRLIEMAGFTVTFKRRKSSNEYNRPVSNNLARLPLITPLYRLGRMAKKTLKQSLGCRQTPRKTYDDNLELWITGKMREEKYALSYPLGKLVALFNRGDDIILIAEKK
jgi:SAM-dependent methyltransferase